MDFDMLFGCLAEMEVVDWARFELATSCLQSKRSAN